MLIWKNELHVNSKWNELSRINENYRKYTIFSVNPCNLKKLTVIRVFFVKSIKS